MNMGWKQENIRIMYCHMGCSVEVKKLMMKDNYKLKEEGKETTSYIQSYNVREKL